MYATKPTTTLGSGREGYTQSSQWLPSVLSRLVTSISLGALISARVEALRGERGRLRQPTDMMSASEGEGVMEKQTYM